MKRNTLIVLVLLLTGCASTLHKQRALMKYIIECEGTLISEYLIYNGEEQFSLRCEEEPPVYIEI